jgi:hypothetical protein
MREGRVGYILTLVLLVTLSHHIHTATVIQKSNLHVQRHAHIKEFHSLADERHDLRR